MQPEIYIPIFVCSVLLTIAGRIKSGKLYYIFKPVSSALILLVPVILSNGYDTLYDYLICAGFIFALIGDMFLMFPQRYFRLGLLSFLLTHIFYSIAFFNVTTSLRFYLVIPFILYSFVVYILLRSHLLKEKPFVILYIVIITVMGFAAVNASFQMNYNGNYVLAGSILFILSDTVLAINKFYKSLTVAQIIILGTYYTGQFMIALSV